MCIHYNRKEEKNSYYFRWKRVCYVQCYFMYESFQMNYTRFLILINIKSVTMHALVIIIVVNMY